MGSRHMTADTRNWRAMTPVEVLDGWPILTATQTAYILGLTYTRGERTGQPNPRLVHQLVNNGTLKALPPIGGLVRIDRTAIFRYRNRNRSNQ
jgi:hypothetical protein